MALSDCEKCWDTPCTCGHYYSNQSEESIEKQIAVLQATLANKRADRIRNEYDYNAPKRNKNTSK